MIFMCKVNVCVLRCFFFFLNEDGKEYYLKEVLFLFCRLCVEDDIKGR